MEEPTFADYVALIYNLFDRFVQECGSEANWASDRYDYQHKGLIVFFIMMQYRRIHKFKTQWRWLNKHPGLCEQLGFERVPDRTTLSRRYKALYPIVCAFVAFLGQYAEELDECLRSHILYEDKSLFKAAGPVWHQSDRREGRIPKGLHGLDTGASWGKSAYHGWVYGYSLHLTCNQAAFPKLVQVETASYSEQQALTDKEPQIFHALAPDTFVGDDAYTKALRIRQWTRQGIALLTPALRWVTGRYARAYHRFITQPDNASLLHARKTIIEPSFDLLAQVTGCTDNQKQLPVRGRPNVRSFLAIGVLIVQIAMIANCIWDLSLRLISHIGVAFT